MSTAPTPLKTLSQDVVASPVASVAGTAVPQPPPVSAQATISQLQEKWSEALSSPTFQSTRVGQWVARASSSNEETGSDVNEAPNVSMHKAPTRREAVRNNKQRALYLKYGPTVERIEYQANQVLIDDAIMDRLRQELRADKAITNGMIRCTIHNKLLKIHKEQILEQRALAQQLQKLNQENQAVLLGKKTTGSPTTVTAVLQPFKEEVVEGAVSAPLLTDTAPFQPAKVEV